MTEDIDLKKQYTKPEMEVMEIATCQIIATSLNIDSGSQGDYDEDFVKEHRGTWGNLWE